MDFEIWKLADFNIIASLCFPVAAWKWGDWRHWQKYYPTILFFILVNLASGYITYTQPLWEFESPLLKTTLSDFFVSLVAYPATILLFLPHYPKGIYRRMLYIFMWVALYSTLELISYKLGFFSHHNGWNIGYSVLFNFVMFPILRLHHKNPLAAWIISFVLAIAILLVFDISFDKMK